jgi:hypothetical protein
MLIKTVFKKQWLDMQGRVWTYPVVAFFFNVMSENPVWIGFVAIALAMDLATRTAGDDARHGTFEFIFTRAIDRKAYFRMKYWFGLPILITLLLLAACFEALGVREAFWSLVREPVDSLSLATLSLSPGVLALMISAAIFLFSLLFALLNTATSESVFSSMNFTGVFLFAVYGLLVLLILPFLIGAETGGFPELLQSSRFVPAACVAFLAPSILLYLFSGVLYAHRTLPAQEARTSGRGSAVGWGMVIVLILVFLAVVAYLLFALAPADPMTVKG